ncbi:MAG: iron-sulfur cluster assembly scaffold protein [Candidatus Pacebacteria bacterium]|nr:iron-sulfur cluster assembly scaffold protein [Candidatus Paceibacterota bacterium]
MYTKKTIEYFKNPKNMGEIKNPDGYGIAGNIICGDLMHLYIKIGKNKKGKEILKDIKFKTLGCVAAIATSSMITELAKGKTIKQAININKQEIVDSLENLPPVKLHCSILAIDALSEAIYDYLFKNKKPIPKELEKRHKRIKKEKQIIKEKYKDWTSLKID